MTENKTTMAVKEIKDWWKEVEEIHSVEETYDFCRFELPAIVKKYQKMEKALNKIWGMERMTFMECSDAETVMCAARDALSFDPLNS